MGESGTSSGFGDLDVAGFVNNIVSTSASVPLLSSVLCSWCSKNGESRTIVCVFFVQNLAATPIPIWV